MFFSWGWEEGPDSCKSFLFRKGNHNRKQRGLSLMSGQQRQIPAFCRLEICAWAHGFAEQQSLLSPTLQRTKLNTYWTASRPSLGETWVEMTKLAWEFYTWIQCRPNCIFVPWVLLKLVRSKLACPSQTCATYTHFLIFGRGPSSILFLSAAMERALSSQTISFFLSSIWAWIFVQFVLHMLWVWVCVSNWQHFCVKDH